MRRTGSSCLGRKVLHHRKTLRLLGSELSALQTPDVLNASNMKVSVSSICHNHHPMHLLMPIFLSDNVMSKYILFEYFSKQNTNFLTSTGIALTVEQVGNLQH